MNFPNAIQSFLNNYFNFRGRASRSEYWYAYLFLLIIGIIAGVADAILFPNDLGNEINYGPISSFINIGFIIPYWAIIARRLHDLNKSALKFFVIPFISFWLTIILLLFSEATFLMVLMILFLIYGIYLLVIFCFRGSLGTNKYGPDPLRNTQSDKTEEDLTIWDENK